MSEQTKRCPFCKEEIHIEAIKCKHCGSMLAETSSDTTIIEAFSEKYEILEEVGRGGMATVYKARQRRPDRIVALKVIPRQFTHDEEFIARFHREADSAANLYHPNIITIHDEGEIGGYPYMAMRYLSGGTLQERIRREGALSEKEIKRIILAVLDALSYAQEQEIVHRDVKSSNIMLDSKGQPVLMDFGIAKSVAGTKLTRTGTIIGTPEYMSPEQARGEGEIDRRSDIYSLGVVLYEMVTGRVPFRGDTAVSVLHKVIHEQPARPRELNGRISEGLEGVIWRAMSKRVGERYESCEQMARALEEGEAVRPVMSAVSSERTVRVAERAGRAKRELAEKNPEAQPRSRAGLKAAIWVVSVILLVVVGVLVKDGIERRRGQRQPELSVLRVREQGQSQPQQRPPVADGQRTEGAEEKAVEGRSAQTKDQAQSRGRLYIEWVFVPGGTFQMGDQFGDGDSDERPVHEVSLDGYYLSATEVTNDQYCAFLNERGNQTEGGTTWLDVNRGGCLIEKQSGGFVPESGFADHPVVEVSWYGARAFCQWAGGRLPTEAEWEYAARGGGKMVKYPCGNSISQDDANYAGTGGRDHWSQTSPVRSFASNSLDLYDMAGNVWEWCSDWYGSYGSSPQRNPQGPSSGSLRVVRGGSWGYTPRYLRCSNRNGYTADDAFNYIGFRLCKTG